MSTVVSYISRESRGSSPWGGLAAGQIVEIPNGAKVPSYLIPCDGRKMVGDQHPQLFAAIGHMYSKERPYIKGEQPVWWRRVFLREKAKYMPNPAFDPNVFCVPTIRDLNVKLDDNLVPSFL